MSSVSTRIINIYKSRKTLLEQLQTQGYEIEDYENFTMNEIDSMLSNSQLDMLLSNNEGNKIYVKYYFALKQNTKQIKKEVLDNIIEDLFILEEVLTKKDTLIVVIDDEPNDAILTRIKYLYDHENIFVIGDASNIPTSKAGSVAHFAADIVEENLLCAIEGRELTAKFDVLNLALSLGFQGVWPSYYRAWENIMQNC